jgi:hypothetical protein
MIDDSNGIIEVNVIFGDGTQQLIYTYGTPNCDDGEPQLRGYLYYLAHIATPNQIQEYTHYIVN